MFQLAKKVAVLILNFNGKVYLERCIRSILNQSYRDFEIYLIDNGSSDGSIKLVKEKFPEVNVISFDRNYGFAGAYNRAVSLVDSEYIVLVNNDTFADKDWLKYLVEEIEKNKKIFCVGSKIIYAKNSNLLDNIGLVVAPIGGSIILGHMDNRDKPGYNKRRMVAGVSGASVILRKKLFLEIGGFDESFFAYHEDMDLCWRALKRGYYCIYTPKSVIYHEIGGSWGILNNARKMYLVTKNKISMLIKNRDSLAKMFFGLFVGALVDLATIFFIAIFTRNFSASGAVVRAYYKVFKSFKKLLVKRRRLLASSSISDNYLEERGLIASFSQMFKWGIQFLMRFMRNVRARF